MRHECCSRRRATGPQPVPAFLYTGVALLTGDEVETGQMRRGAIAQLVERLHGMQEVWGSNPHSSTAFSQVSGGLDHCWSLSFCLLVTKLVTIGLECR